MLVSGLICLGASGLGTSALAAEASTNFDLDQVQPFLHKVSGLLQTGFGRKEANALYKQIAALKVDHELEKTYQITFHGKPDTMRVVVNMDDRDSPDIYFFCSKELAAAIDSLMTLTAEEAGQ